MDRKPVMFADIEGVNGGPATRGTPAQTLSAVIGDAFGGSSPVTFSGDWLLQNTLDGFDRGIAVTDAVGGTAIGTFDPGGRTVAAQIYGSPGGPTPADRGGSNNVLLASGEARFDEAGQQYETQKDVFLDGGTYYNGVGGSLPSGRAVTHTGGGLAANSTTNNHTDTVTLTAGGRSYVLSRTVFDRAGRATAVAADNGAITTITLDGAGRQPLVTDALGNSLQRTFDGNGNTVFITSVEKCTISGSIASESFSSAFAFDVGDRPVIRMDQGADGTLNTNWVACCTWPVLPPTLFTFLGFDSRNNRTNLVDPKQNTTIWEHDGASRQLREKRHLRAGGDGTTAIIATVLTQTAYDANSNTIWLVDSNGGTTGWLYDLLDRNTLMTFHDGSTRANVFNAASDVIGYTDENGSHFANTPDVLGRKIEVDITAATGVLGPTFQYFQFDGLSRLALGNDIYSGTIVGFTRDSINRVLEEQQTLGGDTHYVTHNAWTSYAGTGFTFPSGRQITKAFDALYRKNGINEASDGSSIAAWQFFGGRTATVTLGNGIVTSFMNDAQTRSAIQQGQTTPAWGSISTDQLGYDGSARPIGKRHFLSGSVLAGFTTAYDPSSNKLFERALHAESRSALYANDSMDRLLQYNRGVLATGGGSITTPIALPNTDSQRAYALDALGNWPNTLFTPEGGASELEVRTHNKLNQVTARGVAPASTPILYDHGNNTGPNAARGNGNIIDDGTLLLGFDALNQLIEVRRKSDNAVIATYLYDALRRRVYKFIQAGGLSGTIPNGESRYLLDGLQIVEELGPSGSPAIQYVWGQYIDELTQLKALTTIGPQPLAAGNYYLLSDLLYRSAALTNNTGGIVEAFDTDAYGNTIPFSAGGGMGGAWFSNADTQAAYSACRYVFTGREYDAETQLLYYRRRYLQAPLGRFVSRDPAGFFGGYNLYEYVRSVPTGLLDSLGLAGVAPRPYEVDLYLTFGVDSTFPDIGLSTPEGERENKAFVDEMNAQLAGLEAQIADCRKRFPHLALPVKIVADEASVGHLNIAPTVNSVPDYTGSPAAFDHNILHSNDVSAVTDPAVPVMLTRASLDSPNNAIGRTSEGVGVAIVPGTGEPNILAHELGHVVGLRYRRYDPSTRTWSLDTHSETPGNLMYYQAGQVADKPWCCQIAGLAIAQSKQRYTARLPPKYWNIVTHNLFARTRPSN